MIITTAVSLAFLGTAVLFNQQVNVMKDFWYDKVEVSIFLCGADSGEGTAGSCAAGAVTQDQRDAIRTDLDKMPEVQKVYYESKQQAYTHFKEQFKNSAIVDNVTPDQMPESFRVKLVNPQQFDIIASAFVGRAGVDQVQDQKALLEKFFKVLNWVQWFATGLALLMILVSVILIVNTIRVAAFSRRRETGIMKLVGASNFSIQLPFLLEGAISGFLGAALATGRLHPDQGGPGRPDPRAELPDHPVHHLGRRLAQLGGGLRHRRGAGGNRELAGPDQVPSGLTSRVPPVTRAPLGRSDSNRSTVRSDRALPVR